MMMRIAMCLALPVLALSRMIVQAPSAAVDYFQQKYPNGEIPYSLANYGAVPYGKTISGEVGLPSVL